ncbi:dsDNA nuclease domain-containing protein [Bradyrhizobium sp.]|uniref:dsDNA nuclease domain-containing protein n=1 Tax=Bradyrhizobium sp. TaxID=376 RepID=UPI004037DCD6
MTDTVDLNDGQWPSIDDHHPHEEGGPTARAGLAYQDDIVVGIFLDMIEDTSIQKVHCETHDDIVVKRLVDATEMVEYVQVKSNEPDSLWSVASLCANGEDSVCAKSLGRDQHKEVSRFRIVTLRDVKSDLRLLTYPCYGPGRETNSDGFTSIAQAIEEKLPDLASPKGNDIKYWIEHCKWDVRHDQDTIRSGNVLRILKLAASQGVFALPEQADGIETDLRLWAYDAGRAFWVPHKAKKIISRADLMSWWKKTLDSISAGPVSGRKLRKKMDDAKLEDDQIRMALELRRDYTQIVRAPKYMSESDVLSLQRRVKSELATLRAQQIAGELPPDGAAFHSLCVKKMDAINASTTNPGDDRSAFLKGCMYDIADRCLHRFTRQGQ